MVGNRDALAVRPRRFRAGEDLVEIIRYQIDPALIEARLAARAAKDWAASDQIRDQLSAMGVLLEDAKGVTTWRMAD